MKLCATVLLLTMIGCQNVERTTPVEVWCVVVTDPNREQLLDHLKSVIPPLVSEPQPQLASVDLIVWSAKRYSAFPPRLGEEILVRARTVHGKWLLAYLVSGYGYITGPQAIWVPGLHSVPPLQWYKLYDHKPSEGETIAFTRLTTLGNNDFLNNRVRVLAVVLMEKGHHHLRAALEQGIGAEERNTRRRRYIDSIAERYWD